jgi:RNA polymerase sigma-70 factor (ECF subfamily)
MTKANQAASSASRGDHQFAATRWSIVLAARDPSAPDSRRALESLCEAYWYPLYAFVRRRGHSADEAQDRVQDFFAYLLEKNAIRAADRQRGRFRTFLLTACQRFLIKYSERERARKRGGGRHILSLDVSSGARRYSQEPFHELTPEMLFERRWALALLGAILIRLKQEYTRKGKASLFQAMRVFLTGEGAAPSYRDAAAKLGLREGALKVAVHRLRRRYRDLLREEISHTVGNPEEIDDELEHLLSALRAGSP